MHKNEAVQKRKIRKHVPQIIFSFVLFVLTLLICFGIFSLHFLNPTAVVSPLGKLTAQSITSRSKDAGIVQMVKDFCTEQKLSCSTIVGNGQAVTITLSDGSMIILSEQKDLASQLSSLQLAINQLTIEGKQF